MVVRIVKKEISYGHSITDSPLLITKKCSRKHGHNVNIKFYLHYDDGTFVDFAVISKKLDKVLERYDHFDITERYGIETVEELADVIKDDAERELGVGVEVEIYETSKYGVLV